MMSVLTHAPTMPLTSAGMIAELDAVSLYEQLAAMTEDKDIKKVLLDWKWPCLT